MFNIPRNIKIIEIDGAQAYRSIYLPRNHKLIKELHNTADRYINKMHETLKNNEIEICKSYYRLLYDVNETLILYGNFVYKINNFLNIYINLFGKAGD